MTRERARALIAALSVREAGQLFEGHAVAGMLAALECLEEAGAFGYETEPAVTPCYTGREGECIAPVVYWGSQHFGRDVSASARCMQ